MKLPGTWASNIMSIECGKVCGSEFQNDFIEQAWAIGPTASKSSASATFQALNCTFPFGNLQYILL